MVEALIGTWNYLSADNAEAYMDALGAPEQIKEMARNAQPVVVISRDGDYWSIKTTAGDKTSETRLLENQETETANLIIGKNVKATLKTEGAKLIEVQKSGDLEIVIERTVENGIYIAKMSARGVEAVIRFTRA